MTKKSQKKLNLFTLLFIPLILVLLIVFIVLFKNMFLSFPDNSTLSDIISSNTSINTSDKNINMNEVPYISTYYIEPKLSTNEDVIIDYYVTDYYHKEYTE